MPVETADIGRRIGDARRRLGKTQEVLAAETGIERSALAKIETGHRGVTAVELVNLATALEVRVEWLVFDPPASIVSRRNTQDPGAPSPLIDRVVERLARSVEFVAERCSALLRFNPLPEQEAPTTITQAESLAAEARKLLGVPPTGPLTRLAEKTSRIGLLSFSMELGEETADAATVLLKTGGVALVSGSLRTGRRRLALAHEIGHYLVADEYSIDWRVAEYMDADQRESLLDRFARALLLPGPDMRREYQRLHGKDDLRGCVVQLGSEYRVDMSTLARRLLELDLIGHADANRVRDVRTTRADFLDYSLVPGDELTPPTLPDDYVRAVLKLYKSETISSARALDLLFDTWDDEDLPVLPVGTENEIWQFL